MSNHVAKVGIILPAYNQGKYIDDAITSLKKQTFQDFEVHIVDDGSTDNETPQKLEAIKYDKATVFPNKDNVGVARRQEQHYKLLRNEFIFIFCADDRLMPEYIEECVNFLEENKDYGAVCTNTLYFHDDIDAYPGDNWDTNWLNISHLLAGNNYLGSAMMRKRAVDEMDRGGGFTRYQDWDRWVSMIEAGWKLGVIDKPLFLYRQHPASLSHTASIEDEMAVRLKMLDKHKKSYEKNYREIILNLYRIHLNTWLSGRQLNERLANTEQENKELRGQLDSMENLLGVRGSVRNLFLSIKNYIRKNRP